MIAIPLDRRDSTTISEYFGNAAYFALLNENNGFFKVIENDGCGNGLETAEFLFNQKIDGTIFYNMGEGIFNFFHEKGIKVYSNVNTFVSIDEIYRQFLDKTYKEVNNFNKDTLLDSGNCTCSNR